MVAQGVKIQYDFLWLWLLGQWGSSSNGKFAAKWRLEKEMLTDRIRS